MSSPPLPPGPVPPGLLALDSLLFVNLAGNNFSGRLAAVPPNAIVFNVSACNVSPCVCCRVELNSPKIALTPHLVQPALFHPSKAPLNVPRYPATPDLVHCGTMQPVAHRDPTTPHHARAPQRPPPTPPPQLEGTLPPLPENLWVTDLSANSFSGAVPPLARLPRLEAFLAGGNAFEGPLPELPPALAVLDASYNRLAGEGVETWGRIQAHREQNRRRRRTMQAGA
jgi:hypothetical protein